MAPDQPSVVILAGPNGAGKTTASPFVIRDTLGIHEFVNADHIAQGLSGFSPETSAIAAGRIMLKRLRELAQARRSFAFETTLSTRSFSPWLHKLKIEGYIVRLIFLSLPNPEQAIARVRLRVSLGGHNVPEEIVRRRFFRGLHNLFWLYAPLVSEGSLYDNQGPEPRHIYEWNEKEEFIHDAEALRDLRQAARSNSGEDYGQLKGHP